MSQPAQSSAPGRELPGAARPPGPLVDSHGRALTSLRLSVTDRCNFRCLYCMPNEDMQWIEDARILTYEELVRLARLFVRLGVTEIRVTGGEPTVRPGLADFIAQLSPLSAAGLEDLSLTTNGFALGALAAPLAAAGLRRINVSLDSLDPERFRALTRRDALPRVLEGLRALESCPTIRPIKVNAVLLRGISEPDIPEFVAFARRTGYIMRFIEYMPLDNHGDWRREMILTGAEVRAAIHAIHPLEPIPATDPSSTARRYRFADGRGEVGFINPVSEPFCGQCNRLRLTADGSLRTCLFSVDETDLAGPLRAGADDAELERIIREAVSHKELKHRINEGKAFQRPSRTMSQVGG